MNIASRIPLLALFFLFSSCTITRPTTTQLVLSEPPLFVVSKPLRYSTKDGKYEIVVPIGFVTDLASIPRWLWWWQGPHEATMAPAIIHDYLYWEQSCTKDEADAVMYLAMEELSVKNIESIYIGIRNSIAEMAWKRNSESRATGETRFFTQDYAERLMRSHADPKSTWTSLQADAAKQDGLLHPPFPNPKVKQACAAAFTQFKQKQKHPHEQINIEFLRLF
ncbi:DUF1353 domain-containing protein [Methyloversatilis sp. NSM2]|uniref:DUF1353 domain-containing protein n=1 Tax=Methyloversatilis sp. NSM2 TaxID=3134135 RepID=UPI00310DECFF